MFFHCPPRFIEQPELLIDALAAYQVSIRFDSSTYQGVGAVDVTPMSDTERYEAFGFALCTNRFRANLHVYDVNGLPLVADSPFAEQIVDAFAALGVIRVSSPVEEELDFVKSRFGELPGIAELVDEIRNKQRIVAQSVEDQVFERAAKFADERDALLDELYKSCAT